MEHEIKPKKDFSLNLKEIWAYRELFYFFTWRDIKVKYKQTLLGFLWAVLQPLIMMVVFTIFFGGALDVPTDGVPYPIFVFSGLLLWNVFSTGLTSASNSMVTNSEIIKKIYFPRLIIPMSGILAALFDFCMAFLIYLGILVYYQYEVNVLKLLIYLPVSLLLTVITTFGLGTLIAALNVKYRDFRYLIPFMTQTLLFLTPVIYSVKIIPQEWAQLALSLNPMAGAINLLRSLLVDTPMEWDIFFMSVVSAVILFFAGLLTFRKTESYFADIA